MSNLPREHHRLDTHARHRDKTLAALLWTARFRWTASGIVDDLLGGNGLARKMIERKLLVEHPINNAFSPVRFYATLSREGLALLQRQWVAIGNGLHGETATRLSDCWTLPERPEHRIRQARFMHDLHVQALLAGAFRTNYPIACIHLADDLERTRPEERPTKIPDVIIELRSEGTSAERQTTKNWGEVEIGRKNQREVDLFCAYYRGALAGLSERGFDKLFVYCHESVLAQWRKDFARTVVPRWQFRKATRDWLRLDAKDWHHFPNISTEEVENTIRLLPRFRER